MGCGASESLVLVAVLVSYIVKRETSDGTKYFRDEMDRSVMVFLTYDRAWDIAWFANEYFVEDSERKEGVLPWEVVKYELDAPSMTKVYQEELD